MIGSSLCSVSKRNYMELQIYNTPTLRDSVAYRKHRMTYEKHHPCGCELNAEMLEEESARKSVMVRFGYLVSHLRQSMRDLF